MIWSALVRSAVNECWRKSESGERAIVDLEKKAMKGWRWMKGRLWVVETVSGRSEYSLGSPHPRALTADAIRNAGLPAGMLRVQSLRRNASRHGMRGCLLRRSVQQRYVKRTRRRWTCSCRWPRRNMASVDRGYSAIVDLLQHE